MHGSCPVASSPFRIRMLAGPTGTDVTDCTDTVQFPWNRRRDTTSEPGPGAARGLLTERTPSGPSSGYLLVVVVTAAALNVSPATVI